MSELHSRKDKPLTSTAIESLNPVTYEIIKGGFYAALNETGGLIERTAMSSIIREKKDYFTSFFDRDGRLALGLAHPIGANMMECILEEFPTSQMQAGDLFMYNDCYRAKGGVSHLPDFVFSAPVVEDEQVVALCTCFGHFTDIGGMTPGSYSGRATEVFQEGIIIPPVKLYEAGRLNESVFNIFLRNTRFPEISQGDIRALLAACRLSVKRVQELCDRFGALSIMAALSRMQDQTEAAVRKAYAALPDGTYVCDDSVDSDPVTGESARVEVKLQKTGEDIVIDLTGSSDQATGPINFLMHETAPQQMLGLYFISSDPTLLVNDGLFRTVKEVRIREGSILRPRFPAPLAWRAMTMVRAQQALIGTLALATDGNVPAGSPTYVIMFIRTTNPATGKAEVIPEGIAVGYGARPYGDGLDAIYYVSQKNFPIEFMEVLYPIEIVHYGLRPDSGGPGRWRGGTGVVRELRFLGHEGSALLRVDNLKFPPWGLKGGQGGRPSRVVLNPGTDDEQELPSLSDSLVLKNGDVVRIETCGGGGWGHPFDREPERVREDVRNGMVSLEGARRDYGVILDPDSLDVDMAATNECRALSSRDEGPMFHRSTRSF